MPLLNKTFSSLVGGVSQQPDSIRFDNQPKEQINFYPSPSQGIIKRKPTKFVSNLGDIATSEPQFNDEDIFTHRSNSDPNNRYFVVINDGVRIFYENGTEARVEGDFNDAYFYRQFVSIGSDEFILKPARETFRAYDIGNTTIVLNTLVNVEKLEDTSPARSAETLIFVKNGAFGKTYKVQLASANEQISVSYTTPDGGDISQINTIDTSNIAQELYDLLVTQFGSSVDNWTITLGENVIHITNETGDFSVSTSDGFADTNMYAIKGKLSLFSDLPRSAPEGFVVEITGDESGALQSSYYVRAEPNGTEPSTQTSFADVDWRGTVKGGIETTLDNSTLPFLIRLDEDELGEKFVVEKITYGERTVGDENSAPFPGFVGRKIKDLFLFKNRLCFIYSDSVIMSESGNLFNFFPTAVATLLPADPIEVSSNSGNVSEFTSAIPYADQVVVFSDNEQHVISSEGNITNETISFSRATGYNINTLAKPTLSGSSIYFTVNNGRFTEAYEYYINEVLSNKEAANVSMHIPTYIPKDIIMMESTRNSRVVLMVSESERDTIYAYNYLWQGNNKIQSAWHKIKFSRNIISMNIANDELVLFMRTSDTSPDVSMFKFSLSESLIDEPAELGDEQEDFIVSLDYRLIDADCEINYDENTDETTFTLPYIIDDDYIIVDRATEGYGGKSNSVTEKTSTYFKVSGDVEGTDEGKFYIGVPYTSTYICSSVYIKEGDGQGSKSLTVGRTQINRAILNITDTGYVKTVVEQPSRTDRITEFFGRFKGAVDNLFGKVAIDTGKVKVPVNANTQNCDITIINDTHLPSNIQFIDFVIRYNSSIGRRVS